MVKNKQFISGDEAAALGVKLSKVRVIAAYPITPQTIVVEKLSEYVADGMLDSEYIHVESEHSAIMASLGSCAAGIRTFTATSSQGLLYMTEGLPFVAGSRFPLVMVNANRSVAVPWSIFGDQNDSMSTLNFGWLQVYVENAQEALDMIIQAYKIAENKDVMAPVMVNLDGFILTHTYELVDIPEQEMVDSFLPPYTPTNFMDIDNPQSVCIGVGPDWHTEFRYKQHIDLIQSAVVVKQTDKEYGDLFGRYYGGMVEKYQCDDAEAVLVTVGSITSTTREVVDQMRSEGYKVGLLKLRFLRPFPTDEFIALSDSVRAIGVIDKDCSYGYEGVIYTNVNSALMRKSIVPLTKNYIAGLAGRDITKEQLREMFIDLLESDKKSCTDRVKFIQCKVG